MFVFVNIYSCLPTCVCEHIKSALMNSRPIIQYNIENSGTF